MGGGGLAGGGGGVIHEEIEKKESLHFFDYFCKMSVISSNMVMENQEN